MSLIFKLVLCRLWVWNTSFGIRRMDAQNGRTRAVRLAYNDRSGGEGGEDNNSAWGKNDTPESSRLSLVPGL